MTFFFFFLKVKLNAPRAADSPHWNIPKKLRASSSVLGAVWSIFRRHVLSDTMNSRAWTEDVFWWLEAERLATPSPPKQATVWRKTLRRCRVWTRSMFTFPVHKRNWLNFKGFGGCRGAQHTHNSSIIDRNTVTHRVRLNEFTPRAAKYSTIL